MNGLSYVSIGTDGVVGQVCQEWFVQNLERMAKQGNSGCLIFWIEAWTLSTPIGMVLQGQSSIGGIKLLKSGGHTHSFGSGVISVMAVFCDGCILAVCGQSEGGLLGATGRFLRLNVASQGSVNVRLRLLKEELWLARS